MSPLTSPSAAEVRATARCPHCGTAVEGDTDAYCCSGCELAAAIICGAGLEQYYEKRTAFSPRPAPLDNGWATVAVTDTPDGCCEARLVIDEIRCASCVWLIEHMLERAPGVEQASVSYATGRAHLKWHPKSTSLPELADRIARLGYRPRALGEEVAPDRSLLVRLGVAAFGAMNLMLIAASIYTGWIVGMDERFTALFRWVSLIIATPVALWCASPFFTRAFAALRNRVLHIDLPIALGVTVLYGHGFIATITGHDPYFDSLGMLVALLLAGRFLESRGRRLAVEAATALVASVPRSARVVRDGVIEVLPLSEVVPGDVIDVPAGEELPADGVVHEGAGELRVALLTGEAAPVAITRGDTVLAGTLLVSGAITMVVRAIGEQTVVHAMAAQLAAATSRDPRPSTADRIAPWFTAATLIAAALTFAIWFMIDGVGHATLHTVAVLVVACPCALALSQPLATAAGLAAAARRGLLLRSPDALLDLQTIDVVALDKTGTVTGGELVVTEARDDVLRIAAGLERQSAHPIARAILEEARHRGIPLPRIQEAQEIIGVGVTGVIDDRRWMLRGGSEPGFLELMDDGDAVHGTIRLGDVIRPDARRFTDALRAEGIRVALLTGDSAAAATVMAKAAGVSEVVSSALPDEKVEWIDQRQRNGQRVLFVGDGVNDGPALARADVGIAMSSGAASTVLVADGVISRQSLMPIIAGRHAARACIETIDTSQRRSIVYNVLAVAAAMCGLVNPLVAAVLMPLSSGMVIWGASRVDAHTRKAEMP